MTAYTDLSLDAIEQEHDLDLKLGRRLIEARELADISQRTLATRLGIPTDCLDGHEAGFNPIPVSRLVRLMLALGLKPEMGLQGLEPEPPDTASPSS